MLCASLFLGAGQYVFVEKSSDCRASESYRHFEHRGATFDLVQARSHPDAISGTNLCVIFNYTCGGSLLRGSDHYAGWLSGAHMMRGAFSKRPESFRLPVTFAIGSRSRCTFGAPTSTQVVYLVEIANALNFVYGLDSPRTEHPWNCFHDHGCLFLLVHRPIYSGRC